MTFHWHLLVVLFHQLSQPTWWQKIAEDKIWHLPRCWYIQSRCEWRYIAQSTLCWCCRWQTTKGALECCPMLLLQECCCSCLCWLVCIDYCFHLVDLEVVHWILTHESILICDRYILSAGAHRLKRKLAASGCSCSLMHLSAKFKKWQGLLMWNFHVKCRSCIWQK